jgi:hypothetical protein
MSRNGNSVSAGAVGCRVQPTMHETQTKPATTIKRECRTTFVKQQDHLDMDNFNLSRRHPNFCGALCGVITGRKIPYSVSLLGPSDGNPLHALPGSRAIPTPVTNYEGKHTTIVKQGGLFFMPTPC